MTDTVDVIIAGIIAREGGYVNHPADKGGPTNYGVTQDTLSKYIKRQATVADVKAMTKQVAAQIYRNEYIVGPRIDQLPEPPQALVADMSVLHGQGRAVKILQKTVKGLGYDPGPIDGEIGNKTLVAVKSAVAKFGGVRVQNAIVDARIAFVEAIVRARPDQRVFLKGWKNRANAFRL